jgi:hypothetical protein
VQQFYSTDINRNLFTDRPTFTNKVTHVLLYLGLIILDSFNTYIEDNEINDDLYEII